MISKEEARKTFEMALDKPELMVRFMQEVSLPPIRRAILTLFKKDTTTDE